jgi:hypothetical protein
VQRRTCFDAAAFRFDASVLAGRRGIRFGGVDERRVADLRVTPPTLGGCIGQPTSRGAPVASTRPGVESQKSHGQGKE